MTLENVQPAGALFSGRHNPLILAALGMMLQLATPPACALELIGDPHGERGVSLLDLKNPPKTVSVFRLRASAAKPIWTLSEWDGKKSIAGLDHELLPSGAKRWKNRMKEFIMGAGTEDADFVLGVNSIEEYENTYRTNGKTPWPHLLLAQKICSPGGHGAAQGPTLAEIDHLPFSIEVRMRHATNWHDQARGYSPKLHAAHVMLYLTVQNLNAKRAQGFGDYYWFGITFYDDREAVPSLHAHKDAGGDPSKGEKKGTDKFIYNVGLAPFTNAGLVPAGEWRTLSGDLYPLIIKGLNAAWERQFLPDSRSLADYKIGGMNIGWEAPGLSDVSFQFRNLSIRATGKR